MNYYKKLKGTDVMKRIIGLVTCFIFLSVSIIGVNVYADNYPEDCPSNEVLELARQLELQFGADYPENIIVSSGKNGLEYSRGEVIAQGEKVRLFSTSSGTDAMVKRARQLLEIKWKPLNNIVKWSTNNAIGFYKGTEYNGIPYGQPVNTGTYVPHNVSLENFINYSKDSNSKFCNTNSYYNYGTTYYFPYYSCDCSALVSYAWGISRTTTTGFANGVGSVSDSYGTVSSNANAIKVGDALNDAGSHIILVTNVTKNSNGNIVSVQTIEQTPPKVTMKTYDSLSAFKQALGKYTILRKKDTSSVKYTHNCAVPLDGDYCEKCMPSSSPPAIPKMTNVSVNGSNVTVYWNSVSDVAQYIVDFCAVNGSSFVHNYKETSNTSMTQSLTDGEYAIRIGAKNSAGESGYSSFHYIEVVANPIPISFDANGGELEKTKSRIAYDSINGGRGENQLVIYTNGNSKTGTNSYGIEAIIQGNKVINIENGVGNATVPINGFVVSAHGEKRQQVLENISTDDYINYHSNPDAIWVWTKNGWLTWTKKVKNGGIYGDLPVPLARDGYDFIGWFTSAEEGTQITSYTTVTTSSAQTLYAHWESTYSDTDMPLNTSMEVSKLSEGQYKVDCTTENISPNDVSGILYFAVYSDSKLKSIFSEPLTVAKKSSENYSKTITADRADIIKVFAWKNSLSPLSNAKSEQAEKEDSDWVLKSEMPSGANIVETKYTYTQTSYQESQSVVIDGWENYGSYWKQTASASFNYADFPSGFNTNHQYYKNWQKSAYTAYENDTAKRTVNNTQQGYVYWHWCRGDDSLNLGYSRAVWDYHKSGFDDFEAFTSTENKTEYADGCYKFANASVCKDSYWWYKLPYYQCSYVDYSKMYKFRKIENLESEFSPSGDNVSNIQEWVKYRV